MTSTNTDMTRAIVDICDSVAAPWRERMNPGARVSGLERFGDPRGYIIDDAVDGLLSGIAGGFDPDAMKKSLENFMKLQALEAASPEAAVEFLQDLGKMVHNAAPRGGNALQADAALFIEHFIEELVKIAGGMYCEYRDLVARIREREKIRTRFRSFKGDSYRYREDRQ